MSNGSGSEDVQRLRQQLAASTERAPTLEEIARAESEETPSEVTQRAEAAYWRQRYERSRLRLGKLWVAYKDLEAELEMRKEELEVMAEQKAAALLEERGRGDLLAIAAPEGFEVVSEVSEREIEPGGGTSFPIVMTNRTDKPVAIELAAGEVDEGWQLLLTVDEIELEPKASQTVHVIVRSRDQVEPGDVGTAQVIIRAEGEEPRELELRTTVVEPGTLDAMALGQAETAEPERAEAAEPGPATEEPAAGGLSEEVVAEEPGTQAAEPEQTVDEIAAGIEGRAIRIPDPQVGDEAEPFQERDFVLHCAVAQDDGEDASTYLFFFADSQPPDAFPVALPEGYEVLEDDETGIPFLSPLPETAEGDTAEEAAPKPAAVPAEARGRVDDPFGDIHPVIDVEGIGEVYAGRLKAAGIVDTRRLWAADPEEVGEVVGRSPEVVGRWQDQAELMAVDGVGPQYAELLVRSGVTSIEDLAAADPEELLETLQAKQASLDVEIQGSELTENLAKRLVDRAQEHTPVPEAVPAEAREPVDDPFGDIHPVIDVEGIGEVYAGRLKAAGIVDTRRLWAADPEEVGEVVGRSPEVVGRWQDQAELMAVDGVGPQYAELLVRSGVTSIEDLAAADPEELLETLQAKQASLDVEIQGSELTENLAERFVTQARDHTPAP